MDREVDPLTPEEHLRSLSADLVYAARELEILGALDADAQRFTLGTLTTLAKVTLHWLRGNESLRGPAQAHLELLKRLAWRGSADNIASHDVALVERAAIRARSVERDRFLSQHSEAVAAFKASLAELDLRWGYRPQATRPTNGLP